MLNKSEIVIESCSCEAEIHQEVACFAAALGLGMHGQTELADKRPAGWLIGTEAPAEVLDIDRPYLLTCRDSKLIAVNDDANRYVIHFRNIAGDCLRTHRLRASK
jgi:hypothetical protein